jgi:hypothetical protein
LAFQALQANHACADHLSSEQLEFPHLPTARGGGSGIGADTGGLSVLGLRRRRGLAATSRRRAAGGLIAILIVARTQLETEKPGVVGRVVAAG